MSIGERNITQLMPDQKKESSPATWALTVKSVLQCRECGRLGKGHDRSKRQRVHIATWCAKGCALRIPLTTLLPAIDRSALALPSEFRDLDRGPERRDTAF